MLIPFFPISLKRLYFRGQPLRLRHLDNTFLLHNMHIKQQVSYFYRYLTNESQKKTCLCVYVYYSINTLDKTKCLYHYR